MNRTTKNIFFSLFISFVFFGTIEIYLRTIDFEGTSISDLLNTAGFPVNAYVHKRDRILGPWFLQTPNGYRSNPALRSRGFHKETFLRSESRVFSIGGSTTYGSPFEHEEKGFSERLEKKITSPLRIINAGVAGMDSSAFPEMSDQLANIGGKGVIVYTGNNEIRGSLLQLCTSPKQSILSNIRLYRFLQDIYRQYSGFQYTFNHLKEHQEDCVSRSVTTVLSQISDFPTSYRNDEAYRITLQSFSKNIQTTIDHFRRANMQVWMVIPPINLQEPPQFAHANPNLLPETLALIAKLEKQEDWESIHLLDTTHARASYEVGMTNHNIELLRLAAEFDYATRRITPSIQNKMLDLCTANQEEVSCIDMRHIEEHDTDRFFVDFCHPTLDFGVEQIADSLLPFLE